MKTKTIFHHFVFDHNHVSCFKYIKTELFISWLGQEDDCGPAIVTKTRLCKT